MSGFHLFGAAAADFIDFIVCGAWRLENIISEDDQDHTLIF